MTYFPIKDLKPHGLKGVPKTLEHRRALSLAKLGRPIPHLHNPTVRNKISKKLTGKIKEFQRDSKHPLWKGNKASYFAFHAWLERRYGPAKQCDNPNCVYPRMVNKRLVKKPKEFEWSLIHGKTYDHDRTSYWQLCVSCHRKYDSNSNRINTIHS